MKHIPTIALIVILGIMYIGAISQTSESKSQPFNQGVQPFVNGISPLIPQVTQEDTEYPVITSVAQAKKLKIKLGEPYYIQLSSRPDIDVWKLQEEIKSIIDNKVNQK